MNEIEIDTTLDDLVHRIDAEHAAVAGALQSALGHAIAAGELLIEAKRRVQHGEWLPWLEQHCTVPARTATHYMALARRRQDLCDENGNVLPISVRQALDALHHPLPAGGGGESEWGDRNGCDWGRLAWGRFGTALRAVTHLPSLSPPRPAVVLRAAREGKTPGLTAVALREVIALLTRYADALETLPAPLLTDMEDARLRVRQTLLRAQRAKRLPFPGEGPDPLA